MRDHWGNKSFHSTRPDEFKYNTCSHPGCDAKYDNHAWGAMKAQREGWFLQKNGQRWCPKHVPDWVEGWRAKQKKRMG